ncbi:dTDP-4-dehydrorhamnose 3,5-epimerase [Desulfoluna spongiiphila]|uniref:dTDP-4-dehydrorhamnose 3,5-epimerase n=1 Tax=Desulfoluna spongiiphila TaxID=419481 RepID=UPI001256735D|nr:dTDP-4-dehydrorhamnose 3,5-epimerase [Desulfoluna spongiiphila]VVS94884.1 dtdp-4-dehydrorhamnose 3 5-epimerase-related [Desulfoluna spongiiphila]
MKIINTSIEDVKIVEPSRFGDQRGYFFESWHQERYIESGITSRFVQDNCSMSRYGTVRGLHFQLTHPQAKLVHVLKGSVYDVAVDIRVGSPSFGQWVGVELSEENGRQVYIPEGFAHGFCVLSDEAVFSYKCSDYYMPGDEGGVLWSDPQVGIKWPVAEPILSEKDSVYPCLAAIEPFRLPMYEAPGGGV